MRRFVSRKIHQFAWWLDRTADRIWDIDEYLAPTLIGDDAVMVPIGARGPLPPGLYSHEWYRMMTGSPNPLPFGDPVRQPENFQTIQARYDDLTWKPMEPRIDIYGDV